MGGVVRRVEGPLRLESVACCICGTTDGRPVAVGEDFEYRTSPDSFLAVQCPHCSLVYLDPRPTVDELDRIYPDDYHAFAFSAEDFGLVYKVRRRLEARRLLSVLGDLPDGARVLDVGCGDGFHLDLLREFGHSSWRLEGVDLDPRAIEAARARGIVVHAGTAETAGLPLASFDAVLLIQTVEHVADPPALLAAIRDLLAPGGRLVVVTDNTGSPDFRLSKSRHWGGYHFPRHWNLFNRRSMRMLAAAGGLEVVSLSTIMSPVNWTYSVRNALDDWGAPRVLVRQFSLSTPISLAVFSVLDSIFNLFGRGALLRVVLRRSA